MEKFSKISFVIGLLTLVLHGHAQNKVEAIWHCSRMPASAITADSTEFSMDPTTSLNGTIVVTVQDLMAAYSGYPVRVSGKPLFACFMPGQEDLSIAALQSLGLSSPAMQMLSRRSAIVQRNLKLVTDEEEMLACTERNTPSFGYLSKSTITDKIAPCF
jgi:hypothetical protein